MSSKDLTRKEFVTLTFTLIGVSAAAGACSSNNNNNADATGASGTHGGAGASGTNGAAGASGTNGAAGASGTNGAAGASGTNGAAGASGTGGGTTCTDPLTEHQDPDTLGHVHTLTVPASSLTSTMDMTFTTGPAGTPVHMHMVTLKAADLATIKGGGMVDVMSAIADGHLHSFTVSCH
jgi:hypothetical protein